MIQGALARLGINVTVSVESAGLPQCKSNIMNFVSEESTYLSLPYRHIYHQNDAQSTNRDGLLPSQYNRRESASDTCDWSSSSGRGVRGRVQHAKARRLDACRLDNPKDGESMQVV